MNIQTSQTRPTPARPQSSRVDLDMSEFNDDYDIDGEWNGTGRRTSIE